MDQNALASQMRQVSGGPISASLDIAQPFNVLNGPIHSRTKLLAHAEQANNIGVHAIQRGQKVPPSSPGTKSIMASPTPQQPMMTPQEQSAMQGGSQDTGMQRTASIPSDYQYNQHVQRQPQNMQTYGQQGQQGTHMNDQQGQMGQPLQMSGQQWPHRGQNVQMNVPRQCQMSPTFNAQHGFPGTPSFGGHGAQYLGIPQNLMFHPGQHGGIGPYAAAGTFDGLLNMSYNHSGYNYPAFQQPATSHQMYPNFYGPPSGLMPQSPAPMPQNNAAQVSTAQNHGYNDHHQAPPQQQRPASRVSNIDLELRSGTPSAGLQSVNRSATTGLNSRPPTRNGLGAMPQQNHDMGQQHLYGSNSTSGVNTPGNTSDQDQGHGPSLAATHFNGAPQPTVQQAQTGPLTASQANQATTQLLQGPQSGQAVELQRNNTSQGAIEGFPNGARSTPQASQFAQPQSEGRWYGSNVDKPSPSGPPAESSGQVMKIVLTKPIFETLFEFPASMDALYAHIKEQSKKMLQPDNNLPPAEDLEFSISNGLLEYQFLNPVFCAGVKFSDEAKITSPVTKAGCPLSKQGNCSSLNCTGCTSVASNATRAPAKGLVQEQLNAAPKTPPRRATSSTTQVTPAVESMNLENRQDTPIDRTSAQSELSQGDCSRQNMQNSTGASSNNRASGKRAAPATEQGESPSKRHKGRTQTPSVVNAEPKEPAKREGADGRLKSVEAEFKSFASEVSRYPIPNLPQTLPPRNIASTQSFSPKPSRPLKSSILFTSPRRKQYKEQLEKSIEKQCPEAYNEFKASLKTAPVNRTPASEPDIPLAEAGVPVPQQQQQIRHATTNANHEPQENQSPSSLRGEDFATPEQEQHVDHNGSFRENDLDDGNKSIDNADLDAILDITSDTALDPVPGGLAGDEAPNHDPHASSGSDYNPDPSPPTPASPSPLNYRTGFTPEMGSGFFADAMTYAHHEPLPWDRTWTAGLFPAQPEKQRTLMDEFGKNL